MGSAKDPIRHNSIGYIRLRIYRRARRDGTVIAVREDALYFVFD